jgi:hypothetical protein
VTPVSFVEVGRTVHRQCDACGAHFYEDHKDINRSSANAHAEQTGHYSYTVFFSSHLCVVPARQRGH